MTLRDALRRVWTIALAEGWRTGGSFNKRTTAALAAIGLATALLMPVLMDGGLDFDKGIYRVAVTDDAALRPAVLASHLFQPLASTDPIGDVEAGRVDLAITASSIAYLPTPKGDAAMAALKQAAKDYTFSQLLQEPDHGAAFPVRVEVEYVERDGTRAPAPIPGPGGTLSSPTPEPSQPSGTQTTEAPGGEGGSGEETGAPPVEAPASGATAGGFSFLPPERSVNTPETMSPPFPFRSLLLAYVFLIPMNFVVQVYAGSAIAERLGRKGEPLLASPARPWEIIVGKALPYFLLMMAICVAIVVWIGGSWLSLVAIAPLVITFLAMEFVAAMFARSFRELTFLTVFTSVLLTIYAFLPAVFTDVHPVALVSPITLVVFDLRGQGASLGEILYSTLPLLLFSGVLFRLGGALYREEDLFHQKPVMAKMVDAVARQVKGLRSAVFLPILLIPLVLVAELLLLAFLYAWPVPVGTLGILLAVALTEESFKGIPSYAAQGRKLVDPKRAVLFGALVGVGFFIAEKGLLLLSLVGVMDVQAGATVFGPSGAILETRAAVLIALALFVAPLVLHVVTAAISGWGARQGRKVFAAAFALAVTVHTAYNLIVVMLFQGGL